MEIEQYGSPFLTQRLNRKVNCKNALVNSEKLNMFIEKLGKKDKFSDTGLMQMLCTSKYILYYLQLCDNWEF